MHLRRRSSSPTPEQAYAPVNGNPRSTVVVFFLTVVTFGVYWFVWAYRSFQEIATATGRPLAARPWVVALVILFLPSAALTFAQLYEAFGPSASGEALPPPSELLRPTWSPLEAANAVFELAFLVAAWVYLSRATTMVGEVVKEERIPVRVQPRLVTTFTVLGIVGLVPVIGPVFVIAGLIVWAVWNAQVQKAMNRFWAHRNLAPSS